MFFLFLFLLVFVGALFFYKSRKVRWSESVLLPEEKVLYEQPRTTLYTLSPRKSKRGMAWLFVKMTNKRIFFLYPDKKRIATVFDFSHKKKSIPNNMVENVTIYLEKESMKIESDALQRDLFHARGENAEEFIYIYEFKIQDGKKVKEILAL